MPGMEAIGQLLEPVTTNLYAWRVPIEVASIVAVLVLAVVAWRRDWLGAGRRHPVRAVTAGVLVVAVAAPVGWHLASPVFVRSSLVEAAPVALASAPAPVRPVDPIDPAPSATGSAVATAPPEPTRTPSVAPTPVPFQPRVVASGSFRGTDDFHFGRGTASIVEVEPGRYHLRLDDFSVRNGPDLFVYLSPKADGWSKRAVELGRLKATDGSFGYDLPEGVEPTDLRSAIIWCKQFGHLFATAPFDA